MVLILYNKLDIYVEIDIFHKNELHGKKKKTWDKIEITKNIKS